MTLAVDLPLSRAKDMEYSELYMNGKTIFELLIGIIALCASISCIFILVVRPIYLSLKSGWHKLAKLYRSDHTPLYSGTATVGECKYGRINVLLMADGIQLSVAPWLRVGHPPVFIPWSDIEHIHHHERVGMSTLVVGTPEVTALDLTSSSFFRAFGQMLSQVAFEAIHSKGAVANLVIPVVFTPRLVLRAFTGQDVESLYHILGDTDVLRYLPNPHPPSQETVQRLISDELKHWEQHGYGGWAVEKRGDSRFIGWCGLEYLPETEETVLIYLLDKAYWGQGLATEAGQVSLWYGFEEAGLESIEGIVHTENKAAKRVLEKLGMGYVQKEEFEGMECYRYVIERASFREVAQSWIAA